MYRINDDLSIYVTRGDIVLLSVSAEDKDGKPYTFVAGDVVRIKVFKKKKCTDVALEKDFPVTSVTQSVQIFLSKEDTKIGEVISKPVDYWYEVELNPLSEPQTIIGYDEDGAKVFKLFPEGADKELEEYEPNEDDLLSRYMDDELDLTSRRPVENRVIARAIARLDGEFKEKTGGLIANIHNSEGFIQKITDVCKTYTDNFDKFVYGNIYTAYDETTKQVNGKWQLDCSSFQNLLIRGVTFKNSRYAGNADNIENPLFFNKFDPYEFRLANTMAKWLYDNGYTFKPAADFSNIEAGDLVFFSWEDTTGEFHENAFMHIDHVAMFLQKKNDTVYQTIQYEEDTSDFFFDVGNGYMGRAVLVARIPFPMVENTGNNIVLDSHETRALNNSTSFEIGEYSLEKPMSAGKLYTCCFKGNVQTDGVYFLLRDSKDTKTLYSDSGAKTKLGENEYRFSFVCPSGLADYSKIVISCTNKNEGAKTVSVRNFCLYEGYKRFYTDNTIPDPYPIFREFALADGIKNDIASNMAADNYVLEFKDYYLISLNIPLKTLRSGNLLLGSLGVRLSATRRLPANLVADEDGIITHYDGYLQISNGSATGEAYVNTWNSTHKYQYIMINGMIAK